MMIVEEFSTQFEVEFTLKLCNTFLNVFGLNPNVFLVIESYFHNTLE